MNKLKMLIITQKVDIGDSVLGFFCGWLNRLSDKLDKIYVVCLEGQDADLAENIELLVLDRYMKASKLVRFLKFNYYLVKIIFKKRVNLIFIHMCPEYAFLVYPYAKIARIPLVMWYAHGKVSARLKIAHFLVNKVITSSQEGFRIRTNKKIVTGQGIEIEKFNSGQGKADKAVIGKIILSVGRLSAIKDYETLLGAADILVNQRKMQELKFQIVGGMFIKSQERYSYYLKKMVADYRLNDYIQFVVSVSYARIQDYYRNCDLFVSTSKTGSLDKATLEAMASLKLVLTCNEAFRTVLDGYSQKLMFERENSLDLAEKINALLHLDDVAQKEITLSLRNKVVQGHSLEGLIDKLTQIFRELVEEK